MRGYPMNKAEKENQDEIACLREMCKKFEKENDVRSILRVKTLIAYYKGISPEVIAECYEITQKTLKNWVKRFESDEQLDDFPRSGRPCKLPKEKQEELRQKIKEQNQRIWVARHVAALIMSMFQVCYSVAYLPEFLRKLGLSFHKALHELIKRDNEKRKQWIQETILELYVDKVKEGWRIFFQDEVGFQTEGTLAYTWGVKGEKIEIKNYGRHGRVNLMGVFELGTGTFYGILTQFRVNSCRFRRFLCHLKHEMRTDKIMLICDNARFHHAKWLTEWVSNQKEWLRLEFLPAYSPDFNPIERLWRWIKSEYIHNRCWESQAQLRTYLADVLEKLAHKPDELISVMRAEIHRLNSVFEFYETPSPFSAID
jgi:transposase